MLTTIAIRRAPTLVHPRKAAVARMARAFRERTENSFALLGLFLYTEGLFPLLLQSGAPVTVAGPGAGDPALRAIILPIHAISLLLVLSRFRGSFAAAGRSKLTLAVVGLALLSVLWSDDAALTLRRSLSLTGTTAFGLYLATRYPPGRLLRMLGWTLVFTAVLSAVFALALPQYGISQTEHAGTWRGIFTHKNTLGRTMTLATMVCLLIWRDQSKRRWMPLVGAAFCTLMLMMSQSRSAMVTLGVVVALIFALPILRFRRSVAGPLLSALVFVVGTTGMLMAFHAATILAALGRDLTLTGRTDIWSMSLGLMSDRPWLGFGYWAFWRGWSGESWQVISALGWDVPHAHNGFVDLSLDVGIVGLVIFLAGFLIALRRAARGVPRAAGATGDWPLIFLIYFLLYNLTESAIMRSDLVWVLYVAVVCSAVRGREGSVERPASERDGVPSIAGPGRAMAGTATLGHLPGGIHA
jgi:O-antigen ligase